MVTGKCPGCGNVPAFGINVQALTVTGERGTKYNGVIFVCPNVQCQTILGAGLDPLLLNRDLAKDVAMKVRGQK
jgi:hypothetical protein